MGLFKNNNTIAPVPSWRQVYEGQYNSARHNLLLVVLFTVINLILLVTNSNTYFLFSAYIPYFLGDMGMYLCGKYPAEYYGGQMADYQFAGNGVFAIIIGLAVVMIALYLLCWVFSNKQRVGWEIAALVFFVVDTVALFLLAGFSVDLILDYVFHVWVIVILSRGVYAYYKLKKMPEEEIETEVEAVEEPTENSEI